MARRSASAASILGTVVHDGQGAPRSVRQKCSYGGPPFMTGAGHRIARVGAPGTDIAEVLHRVFGYTSFRGQQQEIIEHLCGGGDAVALMPTGSGKSLCYPMPALARDGTGVVISPLIAPTEDRVHAPTLRGVRAGFLNSTQHPDERRGVEYALLDGKLDLLYLA